MWKQSYEQKKLDKIIFQGMMKHTDPKSLETFSDVAYLCLSRFQVERPTISHVVKKLEISLEFQEISEMMKQPNGYEEIIKAATPPLVYRSMVELRMLLSKGIFLNHGKSVIVYIYISLFRFFFSFYEWSYKRLTIYRLGGAWLRFTNYHIINFVFVYVLFEKL